MLRYTSHLILVAIDLRHLKQLHRFDDSKWQVRRNLLRPLQKKDLMISRLSLEGRRYFVYTLNARDLTLIPYLPWHAYQH